MSPARLPRLSRLSCLAIGWALVGVGLLLVGADARPSAAAVGGLAVVGAAVSWSPSCWTWRAWTPADSSST
jgi:hypothetical protein